MVRHLYHALLVKFVAIHRERIIDGGYLTPERIDELTAELEQHLAQPETLVIYTPLFQTWGRKPDDLPVVEPAAIGASSRSEIGARYRLSGTGRVPAENQQLSHVPSSTEGVLMSFSGGQMPINNEVSRAKVAEAEADAARYSRLHGGDVDPSPPGKAPRSLEWLRSVLSRHRAN